MSLYFASTERRQRESGEKIEIRREKEKERKREKGRERKRREKERKTERKDKVGSERG